MTSLQKKYAKPGLPSESDCDYKEAAAFNRIYTEIGVDAETLMEKFVDTLLSLSREVYALMMIKNCDNVEGSST